MKLKVMDEKGAAGKDVELPEQFSETVREDLIKKAVLAIQNNRRQAYGSFEDAGDQHTTWVSKRRRDWRGSYGHGISRVPRKVLSHRGTQFNWVGAQAPGTVGGRRAHPPKSWKVWDWKLNVKEKRKAIRSAMAATIDKKLVEARGHKVPDKYPFAITDSFESISKTADLKKALLALGFDKELERAEARKSRAGKSALRGRAKKQKRSVLIVAMDAKKISKAASNISGVDVVSVKSLNVEVLAPGCQPGRATLYTHNSIEELRKGLFTQNYSGSTKKAVKTAVMDLVKSAAKTGSKVSAAKKVSTAKASKAQKKD
ncbi:50S ribosomal protein L4 [Candidatus Woesearchaeota archaeon]|nr:50S ribosomal protein L4 [Candidatus Woesearchaeota archaeon]